MKRADEKKEALVYAYGCGEVPLWSPVIREEVRKQRAFWDALVDMDRELDRELDDRMKADDPAYAAAVEYLKKKAEELREARTARDEARAASRSRKVDPALDKALREAASARDSARREVWRLAAAWRKANKEAVKEHQARRKEEIKRLRSASGLYWANYNRIVDDYETGRKTALKKGRRMRHSNPDREDGVLTVQVRRTASGLGASPEELHRGDCSMIQVEAPPLGIEFLGASARRREGRVMARIRVDADGNQVKFPVVMHRPLPTNARVKSVQLAWKPEGETVRAKLCFTVSKAKECVRREAKAAAGGDVGWRLEEDRSLRVFTVHDSSGETTHYRLPADWMQGMDQVERLHERIDEGLIEVAQFLKENEEAPIELRRCVENWTPKRGARWVDAKGLHDAVRSLDWKVPGPVLHWYRRYRHLLLWRDNLRSKLLRRRRELYRNIAAEVASRNAIVAIEELDLSKMARTKKREDQTDPELWAAARSQRQRAALNTLFDELKHQANKRGAEIVYETANTTARCHECGELTVADRESDLVWTCGHCGATWDRDVNAATNLCRVAEGAASGSVAAPVGA